MRLVSSPDAMVCATRIASFIGRVIERVIQ
jgi:hypothetical protein